MGGGGGNVFKPSNLIPTVLTGGLYPLAQTVGQSLTPNIPNMPQAQTPPVGTPPPTPTDQNPALTAQQRAKKLAALRYGFASTISAGVKSTPADLASPAAEPVKTKFGQ